MLAPVAKMHTISMQLTLLMLVKDTVLMRLSLSYMPALKTKNQINSLSNWLLRLKNKIKFSLLL